MVQPLGSGMGVGAQAAGNTAPGARTNPFIDEGPLTAAKSSPQAALALFQMQNGGPNKAGKYGSYRENLMAQAYQAYLSLLDLGGNAGGNPLDLANQGSKMFMDRLAGGQGVGGFMRENADRALNGVNGIKGIDFSTMGGDEIVNVLRLLSGAGTMGMGPMGQYASNNALDDLQYQADIQGLTEPMGDPTKPKNASVLNTGGGLSGFKNLLQRYLALK